MYGGDLKLVKSPGPLVNVKGSTSSFITTSIAASLPRDEDTVGIFLLLLRMKHLA